MRPQILLLTIFLAVLPLSAIAAISRKLAVGPLEPIDDLSDPHVRALAEFAVSTYNSQKQTSLVLKDIRRWDVEVDGGTTKYNLHLLMAQTTSPCYVALVSEEPGKPLELLSFQADTC